MKTAEDYEDDEKVTARAAARRNERRRQARTPHGIESTNYAKQHGLISFYVSTDGEALVFEARSAGKGANLMIDLLAQRFVYSTCTTTKAGKKRLQIQAAKCLISPAHLTTSLGLKPVPPKCERCQGNGAVRSATAPPSLTSFVTSIGEFSYGVACPACHGSGVATAAVAGA